MCENVEQCFITFSWKGWENLQTKRRHNRGCFKQVFHALQVRAACSRSPKDRWANTDTRICSGNNFQDVVPAPSFTSCSIAFNICRSIWGWRENFAQKMGDKIKGSGIQVLKIVQICKNVMTYTLHSLTQSCTMQWFWRKKGYHCRGRISLTSILCL